MDTVTAVPRLRQPIVLVHGLLGFDAFGAIGVEVIPYFRGIKRYLARAGNRVHVARMGPTSRVKRRAVQLRQYLDRVEPVEPIHLIAHSMGGLDSRYMISRLGMAERVLTLTTLGTPHRGTAFADWGLSRWGVVLEPPLFRFFRPFPALTDLTTTSCQTFNERTVDAPKVRYFSVGARYNGTWWGPHWRISARIIRDAEGDNDGLVSLQSARYGESFDIWDGDHLTLANWPTAQTLFAWSDRRAEYGRLVQRLKELGY